MKLLAVCILLFLLSSSLAFADFSGPVIGILDGDTIEVLHNRFNSLPSIQCIETARGAGEIHT